jgi:hypothetical protein
MSLAGCRTGQPFAASFAAQAHRDQGVAGHACAPHDERRAAALRRLGP